MGQLLMAFSHPLARASKVWTAKTHDGAEQRVLVIVTTIPLEPNDKGYKKSLVERLSAPRATIWPIRTRPLRSCS